MMMNALCSYLEFYLEFYLICKSFKFAWRSNFSNSNLQQKETRILETCIRLDTSFCPETRIEIDTRNRKLVFFTFVSPISRSLTSFGIQKTPKLVFCVTYKEWPHLQIYPWLESGRSLSEEFNGKLNLQKRHQVEHEFWQEDQIMSDKGCIAQEKRRETNRSTDSSSR